MSSDIGYKPPKSNRCRKWTKKDVRKLKKYAPQGLSVCARELTRTIASVWGKARRLGIPIKSRDFAPNNLMPWTEKDLRLVELNYPQYGPIVCAERLGRSAKAVMEQASILGLRAPNTRNKWKPEEEQYVIDNYELAGAVAISNVLDRSVNAIYRKAHSLGLKRYQGRRNHHVGWTKQDEATVVGVVNWLAAELGRSPASIVGKARRLVADEAQWPGGTVVPPKGNKR